MISVTTTQLCHPSTKAAINNAFKIDLGKHDGTLLQSLHLGAGGVSSLIRFLFVCLFVCFFGHCEKIQEQNNLKEERCFLTHGFSSSW
jgi:hypothetical protein